MNDNFKHNCLGKYSVRRCQNNKYYKGKAFPINIICWKVFYLFLDCLHPILRYSEYMLFSNVEALLNHQIKNLLKRLRQTSLGIEFSLMMISILNNFKNRSKFKNRIKTNWIECFYFYKNYKYFTLLWWFIWQFLISFNFYLFIHFYLLVCLFYKIFSLFH